MLKIFSYCGSAQSNSKTEEVLQLLISNLLSKTNKKILVKNVKCSEIEIPLVSNYNQYFSDYDSSSSDTVNKIKKDIENSSIVIFASPVYFKNVSAGMKLLLDQITSWTHTFELLGKFGVIIVCGSLNGSTETIEYLNDFMLRLGLGSIGIIEYNSNLDTEETLTEKIESISKKLATKINDDSPPEPNTIQKEIYKNYELSSINDRFNTFEKQKWENMREKYYGMNLEEIMTAKYKEATN